MTFVGKGSLNQAIYIYIHARTHAVEKPFTCGICMKSFEAIKSLQEHLRGHKNKNIDDKSLDVILKQDVEDTNNENLSNKETKHETMDISIKEEEIDDNNFELPLIKIEIEY